MVTAKIVLDAGTKFELEGVDYELAQDAIVIADVEQLEKQESTEGEDKPEEEAEKGDAPDDGPKDEPKPDTEEGKEEPPAEEEKPEEPKG